MATRSKSGLLPVVILIVAAVAVFGGSKVIDTVTDFLGGAVGDGTEIIGDGDTRVMVAGNAKSAFKQCTAQQMIGEKRCGDFKVLIIDGAKMPFIARNVKLAWGDNKPGVLHRDTPENREPHYAAACGNGFVKKYPRGSCDEYPFASSQEGGAGARTEEVPGREQNCQGATIRNAYYNPPVIEIGAEFLVAIGNPDKIAEGPYEGVDIAKEKACGI